MGNMNTQPLAGPKADKLRDNTQQQIATSNRNMQAHHDLLIKLQQSHTVNRGVFHNPQTQLPIYQGPSPQQQQMQNMQRTIQQLQAQLAQQAQAAQKLQSTLNDANARNSQLRSDLNQSRHNADLYYNQWMKNR